MAWCMHYQLRKVLAERRKLIFVEIRPYADQEVSRRRTKQNLNFVNQTTMGRTRNNTIFDNWWYRMRANELATSDYTGFVLCMDNNHEVQSYQAKPQIIDDCIESGTISVKDIARTNMEINEQQNEH